MDIIGYVIGLVDMLIPIPHGNYYRECHPIYHPWLTSPTTIPTNLTIILEINKTRFIPIHMTSFYPLSSLCHGCHDAKGTKFNICVMETGETEDHPYRLHTGTKGLVIYYTSSLILLPSLILIILTNPKNSGKS